jgi:hypothetical protein
MNQSITYRGPFFANLYERIRYGLSFCHCVDIVLLHSIPASPFVYTNNQTTLFSRRILFATSRSLSPTSWLSGVGGCASSVVFS